MQWTFNCDRLPRFSWAAGVACGTGFCLMTIELLAGRVVAPWVGASLYTWTSIIGTVLVGVTAGNTLGGWLADHWPRRQVLSLCLLLASPAAFLIFWIGSAFSSMTIFSSLSLPITTALLCFAIFFPVAFLLSTVSPQVIRLTIPALDQAGSTVGNIWAWNAVGSIAGTFATGFIFLMFFDLKLILTSLAIFLIFLSLIVMVRAGKKVV